MPDKPIKSLADVFDRIDNDVRVEFSTYFNNGRFEDARPDWAIFWPITGAIFQAFESFKTEGSYTFNIHCRFCRKEGGSYVARHRTICFSAAEELASEQTGQLGVRIRGEDKPYASQIPCLTCQGLGSSGPAHAGEAGVPPEILKLHSSLSDVLKAPHFPPIRSHLWRVMVSDIQTGDDTGVILEPGIYQILFSGTIYGFDSKLPSKAALVHHIAAWNVSINPYFTKPEEDAPAQALGIDLNAPPEHALRPWRTPCPECEGKGTLDPS